jgi:hypothetical protein
LPFVFCLAGLPPLRCGPCGSAFGAVFFAAMTVLSRCRFPLAAAPRGAAVRAAQLPQPGDDIQPIPEGFPGIHQVLRRYEGGFVWSAPHQPFVPPTRIRSFEHLHKRHVVTDPASAQFAGASTAAQVSPTTAGAVQRLSKDLLERLQQGNTKYVRTPAGDAPWTERAAPTGGCIRRAREWPWPRGGWAPTPDLFPDG